MNVSRTRALLAMAALLPLAACGAVQGLTPAKGKALPVKAETSPTRPDADQLLIEPPTVKPGRIDELLIKSQPRSDDRFDLPPH